MVGAYNTFNLSADMPTWRLLIESDTAKVSIISIVADFLRAKGCSVSVSEVLPSNSMSDRYAALLREMCISSLVLQMLRDELQNIYDAGDGTWRVSDEGLALRSTIDELDCMSQDVLDCVVERRELLKNFAGLATGAPIL